MSKRAVALLLFVVAANSACGLLISKGPPAGHEKLDHFMCTESDVGPALDLVWAGLNVVGALAIASDPSNYEEVYETDASAAMTVGFAWAIGSTISGITGLGKSSACRQAKAQLAVRQTASRNAAVAAAAAAGVAPVTAAPTVLVQAVVLAPQNVTLEIGQTQQIVATAFHSSGVTIPDRSYTWSSSNDAIASVSSVGLVTANGAGIVTIAANTGSLVGTTRIMVVEARQPPADTSSSLNMRKWPSSP